MSTFTKTLVATAMAVAVVGTATADPKFAGLYSGSKTKISISPSGCPNDTEKNLDTVIGFTPWSISEIGFGAEVESFVAFAGCWGMTGFSFGQEEELDGIYIERKVGKDLTMALTDEDLAGIIDEMDDYLKFEDKCDVDIIGFNGMNASSVIVKKAPRQDQQERRSGRCRHPDRR